MTLPPGVREGSRWIQPFGERSRWAGPEEVAELRGQADASLALSRLAELATEDVARALALLGHDVSDLSAAIASFQKDFVGETDDARKTIEVLRDVLRQHARNLRGVIGDPS